MSQNTVALGGKHVTCKHGGFGAYLCHLPQIIYESNTRSLGYLSAQAGKCVLGLQPSSVCRKLGMQRCGLVCSLVLHGAEVVEVGPVGGSQ